MNTTTFETKVHDFLAQKRIAVVGVSRNNSSHPAGMLVARSNCRGSDTPTGLTLSRSILAMFRRVSANRPFRDCEELPDHPK